MVITFVCFFVVAWPVWENLWKIISSLRLGYKPNLKCFTHIRLKRYQLESKTRKQKVKNFFGD